MLKVAVVGDVMLGDRPVSIGHGIRSTISRAGMEHVFAGVRPALHQSDLVFGNLEAPLSTRGDNQSSLKSAEFRGDPACAHTLRDLGFRVMSVANNHILQHGPEVFRDTISHLRSAGVEPAGLADTHGMSNVVTIRRAGMTVKFLAYSFRPERYFPSARCYANPPAEVVLRQVARERKSCDVLFVSLHWGDEFIHVPSPEQLRVARHLVAMGSTIVVGHHPHVLQGIEEIGAGVVAYSLGNFVFDDHRRETRQSAILVVNLDRSQVMNYNMIPVRITPDWSVQVAEGTQRRRILHRIRACNESIARQRSGYRTSERAYRRRAKRVETFFRLRDYLYFCSNIYRYSMSVIFQSVIRFAARRLRREMV